MLFLENWLYIFVFSAPTADMAKFVYMLSHTYNSRTRKHTRRLITAVSDQGTVLKVKKFVKIIPELGDDYNYIDPQKASYFRRFP